jgi:hypothetical protein
MTRLFAAAMAILALAACSDAPTAPSQAAAPERPAAADKYGNGSKSVVSNTVKYSDVGAQPTSATLRGVTVSAFAYTRKDGTTLLTVVPGAFDAAPSALGKIYRLQFTAYDPTGRRIDLVRAGDDDDKWTDGTGTVTRLLPGAGKNFVIKLEVTASEPGSKAHVPNIPLTTVVRFAPDLAVTNIDVPAHVHVYDVTTINATIQERAGDIGVRADCVLLGNGSEIDRAPAVWVDAGGTVTCAFATRFTTLGPQKLTVAVWNTTLADYDYGNNAKTIDVDVEPLPVQMSYEAEAYQHTGHYINNYSYQYDDDPITGFGYHSTYYLNYTQDDAIQYARIFASAPQAIGFPVDKLQLSQRSAGSTVDDRKYSSVKATSTFGTASDGGSCAQDGDGGYAYVLCTYVKNAARWTTLHYDHYAGSVTYISEQLATFTAPWGSGSGPAGYYRNDSGWGTYVPFGSDVSIDVSIVSGNFNLVASPRIALASNGYGTLETPCALVPMPFGAARQCYEIRGDYLDKEGFTSGGTIIP